MVTVKHPARVRVKILLLGESRQAFVPSLIAGEIVNLSYPSSTVPIHEESQRHLNPHIDQVLGALCQARISKACKGNFYDNIPLIRISLHKREEKRGSEVERWLILCQTAFTAKQKVA